MTGFGKQREAVRSDARYNQQHDVCEGQDQRQAKHSRSTGILQIVAVCVHFPSLFGGSRCINPAVGTPNRASRRQLEVDDCQPGDRQLHSRNGNRQFLIRLFKTLKMRRLTEQADKIAAIRWHGACT